MASTGLTAIEGALSDIRAFSAMFMVQGVPKDWESVEAMAGK